MIFATPVANANAAPAPIDDGSGPRSVGSTWPHARHVYDRHGGVCTLSHPTRTRRGPNGLPQRSHSAGATSTLITAPTVRAGTDREHRSPIVRALRCGGVCPNCAHEG